jgi:hypothetical protein
VPWWGCHLEAQALAFTLMFVFITAFPIFFNSVYCGYPAGIRSSLTVCDNREHHEKVEFDIWLREAVFCAIISPCPPVLRNHDAYRIHKKKKKFAFSLFQTVIYIYIYIYIYILTSIRN